MIKLSLGAWLASFLVLGFAAANAAAQTCPVAAEDTAAEDCPSFTRQLGTSGTVTGSFADSAATAGAPAVPIRQAADALATGFDLDRDLHDGDRFYLRWEQPFTLDGQPTGDNRLVWAELRTMARGTIVLQRLRPRDGEEQLFFASGQAAAPPRIRMPLEVMQVTSGYGLRRDPLDQPVVLVEQPPPPAAHAPQTAADDQPAALLPQDAKEVTRAFAGVHLGGEPPAGPTTFDDARNAQLDGVMARRRARAHAESARKAEQEAEAAREAEREAATPPKPAAAPPPPPPQLFMHTGLDLLANSGTPILAAADGLVIGARPNGLYVNWIRLDHPGKLATVYGHLLRFAPGIEPGVVVGRGEVIGFVGNTGRSTGSHLHFELLVDGRPVNPANHPATKPRQLAGPDLDRLRKEIASSQRELELEREADETVALSLGAPLHPI